MGTARHKRKYMKGKRLQMTDAWKDRVRERLIENKRNNVAPRDQVELAEMVKAADKTAITKMWKATASKLVEPICALLQIPLPMLEQKDIDALEQFVAEIAPDKRERALKALKLFLSE